jgi:hypothetical protein
MRTAGIVILLLGLVVLIVSLFADPLSVGKAADAFGWKQWTGSVVGLLGIVVGWTLTKRK